MMIERIANHLWVVFLCWVYFKYITSWNAHTNHWRFNYGYSYFANKEFDVLVQHFLKEDNS